jgi:hypothetical protein
MSATTIYRLLALGFLAAIGAQRYAAVHRSPDVEHYQDRVRAAAELVPGRIGAWVGKDAPVPVQALSVLKPNVMLSRRYVNVENGLTASVLLVHCADAHHMVGHFPMRCYPARGWEARSGEPHDWMVGDLRLTGMEYQFVRQTFTGEQSVVVANCLLRPSGQVLRTMEEMTGTFTGATGGTSSGAGQIQVIFESSVPPERREQAIRTLLAGYRPVLDAILAAPTN